MSTNQIDLQYDMEIIAENANEISIKTYRTSRHLEERVQEILKEILENYNKERLIPILYTVLKELIINATKANQKRVFFEENNFDIKNSEHYEIAIKQYKKIFNENMGELYAPKCKAKDYHCFIIFKYDPTGLKIEIRNNTIIAEQVIFIIYKNTYQRAAWVEFPIFIATSSQYWIKTHRLNSIFYKLRELS